MACTFCSNSPAGCPFCSVGAHSGFTKIRRAGKAPVRVSPATQPIPARRSPPAAAPPSPSWRADVDRLKQIKINEDKMRAISEALEASRNAKQAPRPVPLAEVATFARRPVSAPRPATLTPIITADWEGAARFTRAVLCAPKLIESTCKRVDSSAEVTQIHWPGNILRGDWAGLARAVDAGVMTEAAAIELAASWRAGVANA